MIRIVSWWLDGVLNKFILHFQRNCWKTDACVNWQPCMNLLLFSSFRRKFSPQKKKKTFLLVKTNVVSKFLNKSVRNQQILTPCLLLRKSRVFNSTSRPSILAWGRQLRVWALPSGPQTKWNASTMLPSLRLPLTMSTRARRAKSAPSTWSPTFSW